MSERLACFYTASDIVCAYSPEDARAVINQWYSLGLPPQGLPTPIHDNQLISVRGDLGNRFTRTTTAAKWAARGGRGIISANVLTGTPALQAAEDTQEIALHVTWAHERDGQDVSSDEAVRACDGLNAFALGPMEDKANGYRVFGFRFKCSRAEDALELRRRLTGNGRRFEVWTRAPLP